MAGAVLCGPCKAHFVAGAGLQISWQMQDFVGVEVLGWWQVQDFVGLGVRGRRKTLWTLKRRFRGRRSTLWRSD